MPMVAANCRGNAQRAEMISKEVVLGEDVTFQRPPRMEASLLTNLCRWELER